MIRRWFIDFFKPINSAHALSNVAIAVAVAIAIGITGAYVANAVGLKIEVEILGHCWQIIPNTNESKFVSGFLAGVARGRG